MRKISLFIFWFWSISLWSQDSVLVTKSFKFEDGLYETFEELKLNRPSLQWEEVTATYFANPQTLTTQVNELILKETKETIAKPFYAVCIKGIPYVFIKEKAGSGSDLYGGLKIRGKLAYFSFEETRVDKVKIQAFNPINGKPFRTGFVEKENTYLFEKMLVWETGEQLDFTKENMLKQIEDDLPLFTSVEELRDWEVKEKLFRCLLIYNDRKKVFTFRNEEN